MGEVGLRKESSVIPVVDAVEDLSAPTGSLSIVFTDIEDSTALWETEPVAMRESLQMHDDMLRTKIKLYQGYEVKVIGDGFMVAFRNATQALAWCMAIQYDLLSAPWPEAILGTPYAKTLRDKQGKVVFRGLTVRMCIHWGAPIPFMNDLTKRMDYIGPVVHRAARSIQKANGGQIVVTREFLVEARKMLQPEVTPVSGREDDVGGITSLSSHQTLGHQDFDVQDLGDHELKGLSKPLRLYLVVPGSLQSRLELAPTSHDQFTFGLRKWMDWVKESP